MEPEIRANLEANLKRVQHLVSFYQFFCDSGSGRTAVHTTDILRSSVVMLHATLEEFLRQMIEWKYPSADESVLDMIPILGLDDHGRPGKVTLGKLTSHRGKTVDELIRLSVQSHCNQFTASSVADVIRVMKNLGLDISIVQHELAALDEFIKRRHHIVHQADRNLLKGKGHYRAQPLQQEKVLHWSACVLMICTFTIDQAR